MGRKVFESVSADSGRVAAGPGPDVRRHEQGVQSDVVRATCTGNNPVFHLSVCFVNYHLFKRLI